MNQRKAYSSPCFVLCPFTGFGSVIGRLTAFLGEISLKCFRNVNDPIHLYSFHKSLLIINLSLDLK